MELSIAVSQQSELYTSASHTSRSTVIATLQISSTHNFFFIVGRFPWIPQRRLRQIQIGSSLIHGASPPLYAGGWPRHPLFLGCHTLPCTAFAAAARKAGCFRHRCDGPRRDRRRSSSSSAGWIRGDWRSGCSSCGLPW